MESNYFQIDEFYLNLQHDGSTIALKTESEISNMPFPGLRPFKTSEFQLFKGRDKQTQELIDRLNKNNFLAVIGSSGTGKSSIVRAGLIPQLYAGFLNKECKKWKIAICRPGNDPIKNLSIAFASLKAGTIDKNDIIKENEKLEPVLRSSPYGIIEVNKILKQKEDSFNLLIIVDQFEELFRFERDTKLNVNTEYDFTQLLINASSGIEQSIFVVLTMRSEFLGDCVKYKDLPEAINKSQYLVPQLSRQELKEAIELPVLRAKKKIAGDLVESLINEIEGAQLKNSLDQLPLLQHSLMRTYDYTFKRALGSEEMKYEHYERIGLMKNALANHAKEIFNALGKDIQKNDVGNIGKSESGRDLNKKQKIAKLVFQALTDTTTGQKGGRRPTQLSLIYEIASVLSKSHEEINEVINYFRHQDTSFIMPPDNTELYPDIVLDISHESLMRNWESLKQWMREEAYNAKLYQRLNERREQFDADPQSKAWIRGLLLTELQAWNSSSLYNYAWAARYYENTSEIKTPEEQKLIYERNISYLKKCSEEIEREKETEKEELIKEERKKKDDAELKLQIEKAEREKTELEQKFLISEEKRKKEEAEKKLLIEKQERSKKEIEQKLLLEEEKNKKIEIEKKLIIEDENRRKLEYQKNNQRKLLYFSCLFIIVLIYLVSLFREKKNIAIKNENIAQMYADSIEVANSTVKNSLITIQQAKHTSDSLYELAEQLNISVQNKVNELRNKNLELSMSKDTITGLSQQRSSLIKNLSLQAEKYNFIIAENNLIIDSLNQLINQYKTKDTSNYLIITKKYLLQKKQIVQDSIEKLESKIYDMSWLKEDYFLQFDDIRVLLKDLDPNKIKVEICKMIGVGVCKDLIEKDKAIALHDTFPFEYNNNKYSITFNKIDYAGNNFFKKAAFITFKKIKNN